MMIRNGLTSGESMLAFNSLSRPGARTDISPQIAAHCGGSDASLLGGRPNGNAGSTTSMWLRSALGSGRVSWDPISSCGAVA